MANVGSEKALRVVKGRAVRLTRAAERAKAEADEPSDREQNYISFWSALLEKAGARTTLHSRVTRLKRYYVTVTTGVGGSSLTYAIYLHGARVELYIDCHRVLENKNLFDQLAREKRSVEAAFGGPLQWQRLDEKIASRICYDMSHGGLLDRDRWPEIQDEMIDAMIRLEAALRPYIESL